MSSAHSLSPKHRRTALLALDRSRLSELTESLKLEVHDRRKVENHVDALVGSRAVEFAELLPRLKREELQAMCTALGLDTSGREKSVLIDRVLGHSNGESAPQSNGHAKETSTPSTTDLPTTSGKLTLDKLERHLWRAADILRGSIDSSDYKGYIFGLLFLKRVSDVYEETAEELIASGTPEKIAWEDKDQHDFFVPKETRWPTIEQVATNLGETLNKASHKLEDRNEALVGVLGGIDFNDANKLGDAKNRDSVLHRLVQHFSALNLRNSNLSEPDLLGRAYEYLIEKFADDAGKKGGEFYTPRKVVQLIVELLNPQEGMRICDPTCGSGGMLIECFHYIERHKGNPKNLILDGQEKNLGTWAIAQMNMLLHGLHDFTIKKGDTIRDPQLLDRGALKLYDRVIANPPFSLDEWGRDVAENDGFGRFRFGIPPKTKGDLAFVQHMVATLNMNGQLGVVMPHGVLFRGSAEGEIRAGLLKEDLIEAVIGLPSNLFYGTGIPAAILIMNRAKAQERKGKVLFIQAAEEYEEGSAQNYLRDTDVQKISATFHSFKDVERYARVVPVEEIEKNDWNLNISRYVATAEAEVAQDVGAAIQKLRALESERAAAEAKMNAYLKELGYGG